MFISVLYCFMYVNIEDNILYVKTVFLKIKNAENVSAENCFEASLCLYPVGLFYSVELKI